MLAKTEVNGGGVEPVWEWMKAQRPGLLGLKRVKWNFEKFLIGRDGRVKERWASMTGPGSEGVMAAVRRELAVKGEGVKGDAVKAEL